jgi:hypothetical protein
LFCLRIINFQVAGQLGVLDEWTRALQIRSQTQTAAERVQQRIPPPDPAALTDARLLWNVLCRIDDSLHFSGKPPPTDERIVRSIPLDVLRQCRAVPLFMLGQLLVVGVADVAYAAPLYDRSVLDKSKRLLNVCLVTIDENAVETLLQQIEKEQLGNQADSPPES